MNTPRQHSLALGVACAWLACGAAVFAQIDVPIDPPPVGAGIVATVQADQHVYTNIAPFVWCPPCLTNSPPCLMPCYFFEGQTASALLTFTVRNDFPLPRTFEFATSQQFDIELIDPAGRVVAAWSDGQFFLQVLTSFTLAPGESQTFHAKMALEARDGSQLKGPYSVRAVLTTRGPLPPVQATTGIFVVLASPF